MNRSKEARASRPARASSRSGPSPKITAADERLEAFIEVRSRLFGIAYRTLGNVADADDVVQDVWLRWQTADRSTIRDASAFLATATVRLAINRARSAHSRRETSAGSWSPEPVDTHADPALGVEWGEALESAVLMLLERLSPAERAAYVLREAFNYEYAQIARILCVTEANSRQLVARARKHIAEGRRQPVVPAEQRRLLEAFVSAAQGGDFGALERMSQRRVLESAQR